MSEQVDLKQVREALYLSTYTHKVLVEILHMTDEIERLREFKEYADKYHNGIYEQFDEWRQR